MELDIIYGAGITNKGINIVKTYNVEYRFHSTVTWASGRGLAGTDISELRIRGSRV